MQNSRCAGPGVLQLLIYTRTHRFSHRTHTASVFYINRNNYKYKCENNLHLMINGNNRLFPRCILMRRKELVLCYKYKA